MNQKFIWTIISSIISILSSKLHAQELFDNTKPRELTSMSILSPDSIINGYPIFRGEEKWRVISLRAGTPNNMGSVMGRLIYFNQMVTITLLEWPLR